MAKQNSTQSLCIAELIGSTRTLGWRRVADFVSLPNRAPFLSDYNEDTQYIPLPQAPSKPNDVRILQWSTDKKTPAGQPEVTVVNNLKAYEVVSPQELQNITMDDHEKLRQVLTEGFHISDRAVVGFMSGATNLVIEIMPKSGPNNHGLMFTDKSMLSITGSGIMTARVPNDVSDPLRFVEQIPVVSFDGSSSFKYNYAQAANTDFPRVFLTRDPKVIGSFTPCSYESFAKVFFKRQLELAAKSYELTDGRKLTKADIRALLAAIEESLSDPQASMDILHVNDPKFAAELTAGIKAMMPEIRASLTDETTRAGIRSVLWEDETIREESVSMAKDAWMKQADSDRKEKEAELAKMQKDIDRRDEIKKQCADQEAKLAAATKAIQDQDKALAKMDTQFKQAIEAHQKDLAGLVFAAGIPTEPLPMAKPGVHVQTEPVANALVRNLEQIVEAYPAATSGLLAAAAREMAPVAVNGVCAAAVADMLSISMESMTASVVTRADRKYSVTDLLNVIEAQPTKVVLVEGVFGILEDEVALALVRNSQKLIVFSIDDDFGMDKLSTVLTSCVAVAGNLSLKAGLTSMALYSFGSVTEPTPRQFGWMKQVSKA